MDTQQILANAGAPFELEWNGKKFKIAFRTQKFKARMEELIKRNAIQEVVAMKEILPEDDYRRELDKVIKETKTDKYSCNSEKCKEYFSEGKGAMELFRFYLGEEGKTLTEDELEQLYTEKGDIVSAFIEASGGQLNGIMKDLGWDEVADPEGKKLDPKALRLALTKAGLS